MTGLRLIAPAKVNLYLHVLGRNARGYHLLDSLTVFTEAGDCLSVSPDEALSLHVSGPFAGAIGPAASNLVMRAAIGLAKAAGLSQPGARIELIKNLPPASGIGGGSSDAAAAIRLLSRLWNITLDSQGEMQLALGLGADVPVCLMGIPALVSGIGDQLEPAPALPQVYMLLANPGRELPTGQVFQNLKGRFGESAATLPSQIQDGGALARLLNERRNDLQASAAELVPEIGKLLATLLAQEGCQMARMSGSGATCFAIFPSASLMRAAARAVSGVMPDCWSMETKSRASKAEIELHE